MSDLEAALMFQIRAVRLPLPEREVRFAPPRRWRFDFAWTDRKVAVEVDGGTRSGGRHVRGDGFAADCAKLNAAALDGWLVLRFTGAMIEDGLAVRYIERALARTRGVA